MNLAKGFSDRNVSSGKISFILRCTNFLKATIYWAQDFKSISQTTTLIGISNASKLCAAIEAKIQRSRIRKHSLEELASLSKVVAPGKLKQHKYWTTWSMSLNNYL